MKKRAQRREGLIAALRREVAEIEAGTLGRRLDAYLPPRPVRVPAARA